MLIGLCMCVFVTMCHKAMTEVVPGLSPATTDYVVPRRSSPDPAAVTSSSSTTMTSSTTSPQHVDFQVETDDVNVNEKQTRGRFLTAKYPKHQMGLIRRRLNVEDWMDEQLKILFDVVSWLLLCYHSSGGFRREVYGRLSPIWHDEIYFSF